MIRLHTVNDGDTSCYWYVWYSHQRFATGTGGLGNKRTNGDHQNYSIVEIVQNTKKSPGDLRRLAVTQTPVGNYQLNTSVKISQKCKIMIVVVVVVVVVDRWSSIFNIHAIRIWSLQIKFDQTKILQ